MRDIVINGRFLSRPVTGVERYGREILAFIGNRSRVEQTRMNGMRGHLWEQFILPKKLRINSILWSPANTGPLLVRDQALTIHDLSPLEHPEWFQKSFAVWYRLFLPILAKRVRVVFTPSNTVKQKVMKRFRIENVIVTPNGVNPSCFHLDVQQCMDSLPSRYILFVGSLQPGKNLQTLLNAWNVIQDDYPDLWLVIVGQHRSIFRKVEFTASKRILYLGYVEESELPGLYSRATLFVLPSFDEGFGLPSLEAMACGTPVVVSDGGALPETIEDAGLIFRTLDVNDLALAMKQCLENHNLCMSLVAKGLERVKKFSWQTSAELIWNTLNET
jgi:glycosyltransferase involved in cell wall biosynthesis